MRFCAVTLGCKVNQYETQAIGSILTARGHTQVLPGNGCDVCIVNTCAVTAESAGKSRQAARRMKKLEPDALIAVCGCATQLEPNLGVLLGADIAGGSGDRRGFALEIERMVKRREREGGRPSLHSSPAAPGSYFEELPPGGPAGRTRALLKIQDGCDNSCAYCVIPRVRGRARSLPLERAADHAGQLYKQGYREIVITGIEISSYGKDISGNKTLTDVVGAVGAAAARARIRLGSLDPEVVTEEFCRDLSAVQNLCNHFHLSLQSGCDVTLRRMGRKYGANTVREAISSLMRWFPDCGITADLIVGFPGETEAEFMETLEFIKSSAFSNMHIFPFSQRPGTSAAEMSGQIEKNVRRDRARIAAVAAEGMARAFMLSQIGKTVEVLFERQRGGFWTGHSGNYLEVSVKSGGAKNAVCPVRITDVVDGRVWGEVDN